MMVCMLFFIFLFQVGTWNEKTGVNFTRNFTESYTEIVESLQNKTLIVTTIYVTSTFLIWTKNFYQKIPPLTLKVVWILLNPTEFSQKIDLLIKVTDVAPSTVEKMRSLQICRIKKITPPSEQTF